MIANNGAHRTPRSFQLTSSLNRDRKSAGLKFWSMVIRLIWIFASALLIRSIWVGFELMSNGPPGVDVERSPKHSSRTHTESINNTKKQLDNVQETLTSPQAYVLRSEVDSQPTFPAKRHEPQNQPHDKKVDFTTYTNSSMKGSNIAQPEPLATVAHAISFMSCSASLVSKYQDAMLILRHSIHQNSIFAKNSTSKYAYRMYAFVNSDPSKRCEKYVNWIKRMGYTPLLLPNPVNVSAISNDHFRNTIDGTGVAGSSELIKLYLYTLTDHPIVVHWDIDVIVLQPMDDLFDSLIYDKDSREGKEARARLKLQQPMYQKLPDQIDAFFTRDIALARPWDNRQVAQGGFLVARPNMEVFQKYVDVIMEANYSSGCGERGGWGRLGYGCKQGAMHYQGVVAYFYDHIHPGKGHGVELDVCMWNQVAHSVIFQGKKEGWYGTCRQSPIYGGNMTFNRPEYGACHDCRVFPVDQTKTVHFTACSKPWQCRFSEQDAVAAVNATTNSTTCGLLVREFYKLRLDLESQLEPILGEPVTSKMYEGANAFRPEYFMGYCGDGGKYAKMDNFPENFEMMQLYGF